MYIYRYIVYFMDVYGVSTAAVCSITSALSIYRNLPYSCTDYKELPYT